MKRHYCTVRATFIDDLGNNMVCLLAQSVHDFVVFECSGHYNEYLQGHQRGSTLFVSKFYDTHERTLRQS